MNIDLEKIQPLVDNWIKTATKEVLITALKFIQVVLNKLEKRIMELTNGTNQSCR